MPDATTSVDVVHLTKEYGGHVVLRDITFAVPAGQVLAVVGPPGAGKTALARILATIDAPTRGVVHIAGFHTRRRPLEARERLGYMPAMSALEPELLVDEYLEFFLRAYDRDDTAGFTAMADVLELADLGPHRHDRVAALRPPEQRKLSLARCLLHDPRVLILDEPLADLDAGGRDEVLAVLAALKTLGKSLVVGTRSVDALMSVADEYCVLDQGVACEVGSEDEIRRWYTPRLLYEVQIGGDVRKAGIILQRSGALILLQHKDRYRFSVDDERALRDIAARLATAGLEVKKRALEPAFKDVVATCFARRAQSDREAQALMKEREQ